MRVLNALLRWIWEARRRNDSRRLEGGVRMYKKLSVRSDRQTAYQLTHLQSF